MKKVILAIFVIGIAFTSGFQGNVYAKSMGITDEMIKENNAEFDKVLYNDNDGLDSNANEEKTQINVLKKAKSNYPTRAGVILTTKDAKSGKKYHAVAPSELLGETNIKNGKVKIVYKKVK